MNRDGFEQHIRKTHKTREDRDILERSPDDPEDYLDLYVHYETLRDGRPIPAVGEWLTHDGPVRICSTGLHASETPYDALQYAPGQMLHQVELEGIAVTPSHTDKVVAQRRKIVATIDATELLRAFTRNPERGREQFNAMVNDAFAKVKRG